MLRLPCFLLLLLSSLALTAQPTISFQIRNEVRTGTTYEFDVYAHGDTNYTFHNRGQLYINYSELAFGDSIVIRKKIKRPKHLFLLSELSFVGPKYVTLNYVDNSSSRVGITWESNFSGIPPLPGAHTEVPPKWVSLYHIEIEMQDTTAEPGISFQNALMFGQQFYLFAVNDERAYSYKPAYPDFYKRAKGRVFWDGNKDSVFNQPDIPLADWIVQATMLATPERFYTVTDSQGLYTLQLDSGNFSIEIFPPRGRTNFQVYPNAINQRFTGNVLDQNGLNFAVSLDSCPLSEVRVFADDHQFCDTNTLYIQYANRSITQLNAAQIELTLPPQLSLLSSSHPFTPLPTSRFQFDLPALGPMESGVITIQDSSRCLQSLKDQAMCIEVKMTPENYCTPKDSAWTGSHLIARSYCNAANTGVFFVIENEGTADMLMPATYYVIADDNLIYFDQLQLMQGDSLRFKATTRGQSMRLVVKQEAAHPTHTWFSIYHESCGTPASKGFVSAFSNADPDHLTRDVMCLDFVAKRDTSATFAVPRGLDTPHYIGDSTELKMGVRFFNPLPNTAEGWISIDSLSPHLDPLSFRPGPRTKPGTLSVSGKGQMILDHYGFELPQDEEVAYFFRISPKSGLAAGTEIFQSAGNCVDSFPPIGTNTLLRTLGQGLKVDLTPNRIQLNPNNDAIESGLDSGWKIFPNPAQESVWITSENQAFNAISCYDLAGRIMLEQKLKRPQSAYQLSLPQLPAGIYILKIQTSNGSLVSRIIIQ